MVVSCTEIATGRVYAVKKLEVRKYVGGVQALTSKEVRVQALLSTTLASNVEAA